MLESISDSLKFFYNAYSEAYVSNIKFRHFRFELFDHSFYKFPRKILSTQKLDQVLKQISPLNAYYSTAKFLNPHKLTPLAAQYRSDNVFLGADIVFDIDFKPFSIENIEKARIEAIKLCSLLENRYVLKYTAFSGGKGFHVVFEDNTKYTANDSYQREMQVKAMRKSLIEEISQSVKVDYAVTIDTRRILRIPGTINSTTGYQCRILPIDELATSATEIIKNTKRVTYSALRTLWDDFCLQQFDNISKAVRKRASPAFTTFVSNSVLGTKDRGVPFFEYESVSYEKVEKKLLQIQKIYSLSDIYIFKSNKKFYALSLDSLPFIRVLKIVKAASCPFWKMIKYKYLNLMVEPEVDIAGKTLFPKPVLVRILKSKSPHQKSKGHIFMLEKHFNIRIVESNICGSGEYKIIKVAYEV